MKKQRTDAEILEALERWLKRVPDASEKIYCNAKAKKFLTFSEAMEEARKGTEFGKDWIKMLRIIAGSHDEDVIEFIDNIKQ